MSNEPQARCPYCGSYRDIHNFPEGYFCETYHYEDKIYRTRVCRKLERRNNATATTTYRTWEEQ